MKYKYNKRPIRSRELWRLLTKARQEGRLPPGYKIRQPYEQALETWQRLLSEEDKETTR